MSKNSEIVKLEYRLQGGSVMSLLTGSCPPAGSNLTVVVGETVDTIVNAYKKCGYTGNDKKSLIDMKSRLDKKDLIEAEAVRKLKDNGYNIWKVTAAGYDFSSFVGSNGEEIYPINEINGMFPGKKVSDYKRAGYNPKSLHNILFSIGILMGYGAYEIKELKDSGIPFKEIIQQSQFVPTLRQEYQAAYSLKELEDAQLPSVWIEKIYPDYLKEVAEVSVKKVAEVPVKEVAEVAVKEVLAQGGRYEINYSI